ncbi:protease [Candidatus Scalindua japonica]|uniref:Protease n=1 Tax=Candidatus Scalindua japonica TaxID=1284222 RepID=A0A286TU20_9BACT|nr:hypothetical protein [Candidatus Scalindua japonica]GAX59363.1 protease [Candidatus Scalindua japonica]
MSKSLLYRLFGLRKVPARARERLENEGIVFDEEGTSCALYYKNFRCSHKYSGRGWESLAVGSLVITRRSFYIQFPYMILCDKPVEDVVKYLELELKGPDKLVMKFEVEKIFEPSTGSLTCYWRTDNASAIFNHICDLQANHAGC